MEKRPGWGERIRLAFRNTVVSTPITVESVGIALYRGEHLRIDGILHRVLSFDVQRGLIYVY